VSSRVNTARSRVQSVQSQVNTLSSVRRVTRCRLCFREIEGLSVSALSQLVFRLEHLTVVDFAIPR